MRHYDLEIKTLTNLYYLMYNTADEFPDKELKSYSRKQQRDIINNLTTFSDENRSLLSDELNEIIYPYPELSFDRLRELLKSNNNKHMESTTARYDEWNAFSKRFDKLTEKAISRFIDYQLMSELTIITVEKTGKISFFPDFSSSYRQRIFLENPVFSDNYDITNYETTDAEIEVLSDGYRLSFVQSNEIVTVYFSDVLLQTDLLNYSIANRWDGSPWRQISDSLSALGYKKDILGMKFLNKKEKALWRLGEFSPIHYINYQFQSISGDKKADELFSYFAELAGNTHIAQLTRQYSDSVLKDKARKALLKELKKPESEGLARLLLAQINDAAIGYPTAVELEIAPEVLAKNRKTITDIMKEKKFDGEYPHFKKMSSLKGLRLLEIQGQPVTIFNEKNMACMVDCFEHSIDFNTLSVYNASTVFLKKDELHLYSSLDGYSGFFPKKSRRRARTILPNWDYHNELETITLAAAKAAGCEKLTKVERKSIVSYSNGLYGWLFYGGLFMLAGIAFALLFCPAMFLIALLLGAPITVISADAPSFSEYFKSLLFDFPWWQMFLFCSIGFGLPMTIVTAIAKRRG